jgi:hypothetical protein
VDHEDDAVLIVRVIIHANGSVKGHSQFLQQAEVTEALGQIAPFVSYAA